MKLYELIGLLDAVTDDGDTGVVLRLTNAENEPVGYDREITEIGSWRGDYQDATLFSTTLPADESPSQTVADLKDMLESAIETTMVGYKGGEFPIEGFTPVWADDYGECPGFAPERVFEEEGLVVIEARNQEI